MNVVSSQNYGFLWIKKFIFLAIKYIKYFCNYENYIINKCSCTCEYLLSEINKNKKKTQNNQNPIAIYHYNI